MTWQQASHEAAFTAKDSLFAGGRRTDLRLAYRTLGELAPDKDNENAILLLHGTVGSGRQFLQPTFANAGEPIDARAYFVILPDAIGHGKSAKPRATTAMQTYLFDDRNVTWQLTCRGSIMASFTAPRAASIRTAPRSSSPGCAAPRSAITTTSPVST
jgi:pimeloyl-ACP methyl ester carboxylesterase